MDGAATLCAVDGSIYCFAASTGPGRATLAPHSVDLAEQHLGTTRTYNRHVARHARSHLVVRLLQRREIELLHPHQRLHYVLRFLWVRLRQEVHQAGRHDLPAHAEPVGHPAAQPFVAAGGELRPEFVDVRLRLTVDDERDRRRELEVRAAVERGKLLSIEHEADRHDRSPGTGSAV